MAKRFKELETNKPAVVTALLLDVEEKQTKNGGTYCRLTLSDGIDKIIANRWDVQAEALAPFKRSLVSAVVTAGIYQGNPSYTVSTLKDAPTTARIEDYIESAPLSGEEMYKYILDILRSRLQAEGDHLLKLTERIYEDNKEKLLRWSAAKSVHHNCYGGLLYHTYRMMLAAKSLTDVYPLASEVLLPAVALHDIGKIEELQTDELGVADYTNEGNLLGHTLLGIAIVDDMARKLFGETPDEKTEEMLRQLKHAIAAHHGRLEWGALAVPATREAMLLHELDMIDSRMYQFEKIERDLAPGTMSDRVATLDGARIYHPMYARD